MTDLVIKSGDSRNYRMTVFESDGVTPVDITNAILRFAVKECGDDPNTLALFLLTSYNSSEILKSDPVNGEMLVQVQARHTARAAPAEYLWDLEVVRPGGGITVAGTVDLTGGNAIIVGTGLVLSDVGVGDVITPAGVPVANQLPLVITAVGGDGSELDPGVGNLLTDYTAFAAGTEAGVSHAITRGNVKTPSGLSGLFTITADVVS